MNILFPLSERCDMFNYLVD